jgi:hypothetical protein
VLVTVKTVEDMCNCGNNGCGGNCGGVSLPAGPAGPSGLNAFTFTTASFAQPAFGASAITVSVSGLGQYTGLWATVGQWIFIEEAGTFIVTARTPTSISIQVPSAAIETLNNAIETIGNTVSTNQSVSPSGIQGVQGIQGAPGTNGTNASELIAYRITPPVMVPPGSGTYPDLLASAVTIPANSWNSTGDVVKLVFIAMGTIGTNTATIGTDYVTYQFRIVINGVPIETTATAAIVGKTGLNAMLMEIDLIGIMNGGFVDIYKHKQQTLQGGGVFGAPNNFTVGSTYSFGNSTFLNTITAQASGIFPGLLGSVNPTVNNTLKIDGTFYNIGLLGTGGTNLKELVVPYLKVSVHKAP